MKSASKEKNTELSLTNLMEKYNPVSNPIEPDILPEPQNYDISTITYVTKHNYKLLESYKKDNDKRINQIFVNCSGIELEDCVVPEFDLGYAGALNYGLSFVDTGYVAFTSLDLGPELDMNYRGICHVAAPEDLSHLWKSFITPKILSVRTDAVRRCGFNWDLDGLVVKEFLFYLAISFVITFTDVPPYKEEQNNEESALFRREILKMYPALFGTTRNAFYKVRPNIRPVII